MLLPGESHGQRSLADSSPWGYRVRHYWATIPHYIPSTYLQLEVCTFWPPSSSWLSSTTLKVSQFKVKDHVPPGTGSTLDEETPTRGGWRREDWTELRESRCSPMAWLRPVHPAAGPEGVDVLGRAWLSQPRVCPQAFLVIKISNFTVPALARTCPGRERKDCLRWTQPQAPGRGVLPQGQRLAIQEKLSWGANAPTVLCTFTLD